MDFIDISTVYVDSDENLLVSQVLLKMIVDNEQYYVLVAKSYNHAFH